MTSFEASGTQHANFDVEMAAILESMLKNDETITARAVARKHSRIGHASSITRHESRAALLKNFQTKQQQYRAWHARAPKRGAHNLTTLLAQRDLRIAELEGQISALKASHLAMIKTVGEMGGMSKLLKLYTTHSEMYKELVALSLVPPSNVKEFPSSI